MISRTSRSLARGSLVIASSTATSLSSGRADLVQIDLIGNQITASGGTQLFADLDGDGQSDITLTSSTHWSNELVETSTGSFYRYNGGRLRVDGLLVLAFSGGASSEFDQVVTAGPGEGSTGLLPVSLTGVAGNAWIELERRAEGWTSPSVGDPKAGVYITRVIYDDDPAGDDEPDVAVDYELVGSVAADGFQVEVTSFSVAAGKASISIKGRPNTIYTCKSSTTLSGFAPVVPTAGSTTTDANGVASFDVDASGPKRFYVVEE